MKNAFYFILKASFDLKIFNCLSRLLCHVEKWVDQRDKVDVKIHDLGRPGKNTIATHILPNISRSKDNQTMKFGQLIEYNMRNVFLEKSYKKCCGETSPRPFYKKSKLSISLDQLSKSLYRLFLLYAKLRAIEIY